MDFLSLRSRFARYGLAVLLVLGAVGLRWMLTPVLQDKGASLFIVPAVLLAAMLGGFGPGVAATALATFLLNYLLIPPSFSLRMQDSADIVRMAIFAGVGVTVSWLAERGRAAQRALALQKEALRISEERLRLAADAARVGVFDWDIAANRSVWTPQMEALHGMAPGDYDGDYDRWLSCLHPDDVAHAQKTIQNALSEGSHEAEWRVVQPDGSVRWIEARGWIFRDSAGKAARMMGVNIDITGRKTTEEALRQSEANFRALVEHAPDAVFVADREGIYRGTNGNITRLLGYAPEEFIGKRIRDLVRPEELTRLERVERDPQAEAPHVAEWEMRHKDGHYVAVELSSRLLPDGRWVAFARDISERRATQHALQASEARFREMADAAPAMLWITNEEGECTFLSRGWYEFTGQDESTGLGIGWTDAVHPDDRESAGRGFLAASARREIFRSEFRVQRPSGEYRWVIDAGQPRFAEDGSFRGMIGSVIDIHERRHAEDRLRTLAAVVENCAEFIGVSTPEMKPIFVNEAGRQMVGLDSMEDVEKTSVFDYFHPDDRQLIEREALPRLRADGSWVGEVRFRHFKTGETIHTLWNAFVIRDARGQPIALATVSPNLNVVKAAEAAARTAREIAEAANRAKDAFLAALSHELRTPLNPVLMLATDQSRNETLSTDVREDFALIRQNVELEVRLIDDLLDLTRITRGKLEIRKQRCRVDTLLDASIAILRGDLTGKNLTILTEYTASDHSMEGDPVRLQQVFWNILRNAVRFTPAGGTIRVRTEDAPKKQIRITISDTGAGIDASELSKIFAAFEQGSAGHRFGGLGLGLAISRSLLEMHGGKISAQSEGLGRGSLFSVELPLGISENSIEPIEEIALPPVAPTRNLRILLVEDHEPTRITLGRLLQRRGYVVETAGTLAVAREVAAARDFDLFISDLGLPDGDGAELMIELGQTGGPPGIALSGYGMEEDVARSRAAGFFAHLTKPVDIDALDRVLGDWPAP
jgi:PAS domain S-box-containing protein